MNFIDIAKILVTLLGGLAFFLYGMNIMTNGLEKMAGGKLESILKSASSSKVKGVALGCGVTAVIQSSSATTVMLVGLVGSGIMTLPQTIGMLMGSNIGTTITPWITGLSSLKGGEAGGLEFLDMLKPSFFTPIIALIGIILIMFFGNKNRKNKHIGAVCLGFAILMQGMELMSDSMSFLSEKDAITGNLVYGDTFFKVIEVFEIPVVGIWLALIVGTLFTAVIQSSSASTGVLQVLVAATTIVVDGVVVDGMSYGVVIPLILGINIGTCVTAVISSLGANSNAKRVAVTHLTIKLTAALLCMIPFMIISAIGPDFLNEVPSVWGIATFHTLFNVIATTILYPFTGLIMKLSYIIVKEKKDEGKQVAYLDPILIQQSPAIAISECSNFAVEMCKLSSNTVTLSLDNLYTYNSNTSQLILDNEELIDKYEDNLGTYLVKISSRSITDADSRKVSKLLHTIGDFERLSDHAINIMKVADEMNEKKISFSEEAKVEIGSITLALREILSITTDAFITNDVSLAKRVEPLEQVIDTLIARSKNNHISRLQAGNCTIELGFILSDLLNNYSRVSDHCSNIAVAIIETAHSSFETHEYLNALKSQNNQDFVRVFNEYAEKYQF